MANDLHGWFAARPITCISAAPSMRMSFAIARAVAAGSVAVGTFSTFISRPLFYFALSENCVWRTTLTLISPG